MPNNKGKHKQPRKRDTVVKKASAPAAVPKPKGTPWGSLLGSAAGSILGGPEGGALGGIAGGLFDKLIGNGDYELNKNDIIYQKPATFTDTEDGILVCNTEYIRDVKSSTNFALWSADINPGNEILFPWLSQLAQNFQVYEFTGLVFLYNPLSGNAVASTNAALGTVIYATQYDVLDGLFTNKRQMESYEFSTSVVPCAEAMHGVECKTDTNVLKNLYISNFGSERFDSRFHNLGRFSVGTVGMQSVGATMGELKVAYRVILRKPKLSVPPMMTVYGTGTAGTVIDDVKTLTSRTGGAEFCTFANSGSNLRVYMPTSGIYRITVSGYTFSTLVFNGVNVWPASGVVAITDTPGFFNYPAAPSSNWETISDANNSLVDAWLVNGPPVVNGQPNWFEISLTGSGTHYLTITIQKVPLQTSPATLGSYLLASLETQCLSGGLRKAVLIGQDEKSVSLSYQEGKVRLGSESGSSKEQLESNRPIRERGYIYVDEPTPPNSATTRLSQKP